MMKEKKSLQLLRGIQQQLHWRDLSTSSKTGNREDLMENTPQREASQSKLQLYTEM